METNVMRKGYLFFMVLFCLFLSIAGDYAQCQSYNPRYWLEGVDDPIGTDSSAKKMIDSLYAKGWRGVWYWGADPDEDKMIYYFKSPFLQTQSWAVAGNDGLTSLLKAAHNKQMKVMVNIEGVNPYHWEQNHWTTSNIDSVAKDLASTGVDGVFEEVFEYEPAIFLALSNGLGSRGVQHVSGNDPMGLREPFYPVLWRETDIINMYHYYLKRNKPYDLSALVQHGSLGYGWAKFWNKPTSLTSPLNRDWGIATEYAPAVSKYLCMIRALQFRIDNFMIFGGVNAFDPLTTQAWINGYISKQETRPLLNIVVLLEKGVTTGQQYEWNRLFNSGDAITSGAFNAGYNVIVSDTVIDNADAYWIYATGGPGDVLPTKVTNLFNGTKKVFIQACAGFPGGAGIDHGWNMALQQCGIDATEEFLFDSNSTAYTGYYNDQYMRYTGWDVNWCTNDMRWGTIFPAAAVTGQIYSRPNEYYGKGPFIVGQNNKYAISATCLDWAVSYPISQLLSGSGVPPTSNVWGIAGKNVSAFLAVESTELELVIPGLANGSNVHVVIWDKYQNKKLDTTLIYQAPYRQALQEYDLILIDKI